MDHGSLASDHLNGRLLTPSVKSWMSSHIIQRRTPLIYLDDLDRSIRTVHDGYIGRERNSREAEGAIAGLIEAIDKGNVEVGGVVAAKAKVDECVGPLMATSED